VLALNFCLSWSYTVNGTNYAALGLVEAGYLLVEHLDLKLSVFEFLPDGFHF
jgi:hypothetical protein